MGSLCCYKKAMPFSQLEQSNMSMKVMSPDIITDDSEDCQERKRTIIISQFECHSRSTTGKGNAPPRGTFSMSKRREQEKATQAKHKSDRDVLDASKINFKEDRKNAPYRESMAKTDDALTSSRDKKVAIDLSGLRREGRGQLEMKYEVMHILGKGSFGEVRKIRNLVTGEIRAAKFISKTKCLTTSNFAEEIQILKKLDHPGVLKLFEFYQDSDYHYIVTEYCGGGDLLSKITALEMLRESEVANIMKQIFAAACYCHKNHIVHRDLKLENILFLDRDSESLKIIDFGRSKILKPREKINEYAGSVLLIYNKDDDKTIAILCSTRGSNEEGI